jgi:hypothetical protein
MSIVRLAKSEPLQRRNFNDKGINAFEQMERTDAQVRFRIRLENIRDKRRLGYLEISESTIHYLKGIGSVVRKTRQRPHIASLAAIGDLGDGKPDPATSEGGYPGWLLGRTHPRNIDHDHPVSISRERPYLITAAQQTEY